MSSNKKNRKKYLKDKKRDGNNVLYPAFKNTYKGKLYGYIDEGGLWGIEPGFTIAYDFNEFGLAIVEYEEKLGLINVKGEFVVNPTYDSINEFVEMRAAFTKDSNMGVMNEKGEVITKKTYNYIGDYKDSRAVIAVSVENGNYTYGYIDLDGNEIIPPKYLEVNDFKDGVALVKNNNKKYSLINKEGEVLNTYKYEYVAQYGDGLMIFANSYEGPYGFINKNGDEVIKAIYKEAQGFKDKLAIVSEEENFNGPYGVINLTGKYVYQPIFDDIKILGEDKVALGMGIGEEKYIKRNIYAIGDVNGNKLTDFLYLSVGEYKNELAYAFDEEYIFFIDKYGRREKALPIVSGSGELSIKNNLVYANVDYSPYYLDKSGKVIYKPNDEISLDNNYSVTKEKYKPNVNYLIYYPLVNGIKNKGVQAKVNSSLKEISDFKPLGEDGQPKAVTINKSDVLDYDYYGDFTIKHFKKNILILDISGYYYPIGAVHGMPSMKTPIIDLITGRFYTIGDLFMGSVYWLAELNKIIKRSINTDSQYNEIFKDEFKGIKTNQDFYLDDNNLYIYFTPYEIAPYAAGFVTFKIPFSEIDGIINKNGEFYNALN